MGKQRKKRLNARRHGGGGGAAESHAVQPLPSPAASVDEPLPEAFPDQLELPGGFVLDGPTLANSPLLPYVRIVVNLIEGLRLTREELVQRLRQALRQRSIARRPRADYLVKYLHQHPP